MKNSVLLFAFCASFFTYADTALKPVDISPYQKSLYEAGEKSGINNAAPVAKQSFGLYTDEKKIGTFISGQGFSEQNSGICLISWATAADNIDVTIPTIGKDRWEAEACNGTVTVGVLSPEGAEQVIIGVIYKAQSPNTSLMESVIFAIDKQQQKLTLDQTLTEKIGSQGASTLGSLRRLYQQYASNSVEQPPTEDSSLLQVEEVIKAHKLVPNAACVNYLLTKNAEPGVDLVDIVEKHGGDCPGDPETQPRLFSVYVDQKSKQMISDKDDPVEGNFTLLLPGKAG